MVRTELRKIIGKDVFCMAKSDDDTYWDISFPLERLPLSDLHRILEALDATDSQRDLSLPPEEDHADSVSSLSMTVSQLLLRRNLGYDWECLHLAEDSFWVLGVRDTLETDDFIKIGSQRFPLGELKNCQEVLEHLRENGASHRALMDICGEYMEKYQNELCWYVAEALSKRSEAVKLLILVSDGQPADTGYCGTAAEEDLRGIKQEYQRKGILFVAAAIGNDKQNIERIYGDSFLDITDLNQLPTKLTGVVKRHIRV